MPDKRKRSLRTAIPADVHLRPSSDDQHEIFYFQRDKKDDPDQSIPAQKFLLQRCPRSVMIKLSAILTQVAAAPPKRFSGGGYWEAMKGEMSGYFEARGDGPHRHHYRLFCLLDYDAEGRTKPLLVVITGLDKPFRTELTDSDYAAVRALGNEYLARNPRSLV
jgi:hypothetical protein